MAKRTKELSQLIADKTNITKWKKAIEKATGGTEVYVTIGMSKDDWDNLEVKEQKDKIFEYKENHPEIRLERNKKTLSIDFKNLAIKAAEADNEDERNRILAEIKKYKEYEEAKTELDAAVSGFEKAKKRLKNAKDKLKEIEERLVQ